jgi:tetratricopeptide (TPR) repeat protein
LLDNFEDEVDIETGRIKNAELAEVLRCLLELPPSALKVIITTRFAPRDLTFVEPSRQSHIHLDEGLDHPYAENILRAMDIDGKVGLRNAPEPLLTLARERTRGYPRALEHLFAILSTDANTSLKEILENTRQLLPDQVITVLVGEAFSRLDLTAQRVMQALAIYRYPVPPAAVDYLLQPHVPGVDSGPVLSRLVNMQFARRDSGRYYLHQIDRDYAESRLLVGEPADRAAQAPTFSRFSLQHRAAEWFKLARKPRENWKTLEDLAPQLSEFELRYQGQDYDTAASVLLEIDHEYLILWGHYLLVTELHERLQGHIADQSLAERSVGNLGTGYYRMGQQLRAIKHYQQALNLARDAKNRFNEGVWLCWFGNCYAEIGQSGRAIEYYEESLLISREIENRAGEAANLGNLGNRYAEIGRIHQAIEHYQRALKIDRELGYQADEAAHLCNLGNRYADLAQTGDAFECLNSALAISRDIGYRLIDAGAQSFLGLMHLAKSDMGLATGAFTEAIEIGDDTANVQFQKFARLGLATTYLYQSDLSAARETAEAAQKYDFPSDNHRASVLLGVIAIRQGDHVAARNAFATALHQAGELLIQGPQFYDALDTNGLALCGLALLENPSHIPAAKEAYQVARALTCAPGIVARVLRLFDALVQADPVGILVGVRPYAAGEVVKSASVT